MPRLERTTTVLRRSLLLAAAGSVSACASPLSLFNALAPRDAGATRLARDEPYGPGRRHQLDVYGPKSAMVAGPLIVFFYGGSWSSGDKNEYAFVGEALAAKGCCAALPDYRIAPDVFPSFLEDGARAIAWISQNAYRFGADGQRVVLAGHSAGAYIAAMLGLDQSYLRAAGVDPAIIRGVAGLSGPYDFLPLDVDATRAAFGHVTDLTATQPVSFARSDAPPFFLGWGERDDLVGRRNIEGLSRALQASGASVNARIYPELDHAGTLLALSRPFRDRAPVLPDLIAFAGGLA